MSLRGVQKPGARTITSALHGVVRDDPRTRQEFLDPDRRPRMSSSDTFVIVGAGMAGGKAAETLREEGFDGRIVLVGAEAAPPVRAAAAQQGLPARRERAAPPGCRRTRAGTPPTTSSCATSTAAESVDADAGAVVLSGGERLDYDRLLLATGAEPRGFRSPAATSTACSSCARSRTPTRSAAIIEGGGRLVVIGGGWIGCEAAASARQKGMDVTLIESLELPLLRVLGPDLGAFYRDVHQAQGVDMLFGAGVEAIEGAGRAERVRLADGRTIDCAAVSSASASPRAPRSSTASRRSTTASSSTRGCGRASTGIFAAGDVANADHPLFGRACASSTGPTPSTQGPAAARIDARPGRQLRQGPVLLLRPVRRRHGVRGAARPGLGRARRPRRHGLAASSSPSGCATARSSAGMNVNVWDVNDPIQAIIASGATVDREQLADPDVPLEEVSSSPAAG